MTYGISRLVRIRQLEEATATLTAR